MNNMTNDPTLERLEDQIRWYNRNSNYAQSWFKRLKFVEILAAGCVPLAAGLHADVMITGGLGVLIVVTEGLQQVNQYHHNWVSYRSTCEALKHEKHLYFAKAGPYLTAADPHALLAERIESLISQEHAKWVSTREETAKEKVTPKQEPK
jgi:hypothetical protein